jgi:TonB family protein
MPVFSKSPLQISLAFVAMGFLGISSSSSFAATDTDSAPEIDLSSPNAQPYFPQTAITAGEHGTAVVAVHVNAIGTPFAVQLDKTSGFDDLDKQAIAAVRNWHFKPAKRGGEAVSEWTSIGVRFDNAGVSEASITGDTSAAEADRNRVVCHTDKHATGSNIPPAPVCLPKWQWDQRAAYDQKTLQDAQGRGGMMAAPSHGH